MGNLHGEPDRLQADLVKVGFDLTWDRVISVGHGSGQCHVMHSKVMTGKALNVRQTKLPPLHDIAVTTS